MCKNFKIILIFINFSLIYTSDFYKMQDGYLNENSLQGSEKDVHLEDFFWTGSGDGPRYIKRPLISMSDNSETFIKTATILATVYIDDTQEMSLDPLCVFDCNDVNNQPDNYYPSDRRFWLLTIIAGFFGPNDYPILEDKLAKLYRLAFIRQQARHLGIKNQTQHQNNNHDEQSQYEDSRQQPPQQPKNENHNRKKRKIEYSNFYTKRRKLYKRNTGNVTINENIFLNQNHNKTKETYLRRRDPHQVNIIIHNVTWYTENNITKLDNEVDTIYNRTSSTISPNQTEIIYTVFVGGAPVLATTAAQDMKYVSQDEVVKVMEKMVYAKSEPYLKEPQATPLIPANINNRSHWVQLVSENPILFVLCCAAIFLLVVILMGILLLTTTRYKKRSDKLKSKREELIEVSQTQSDGDHGGIVRAEEVDDGGVANLGYNKDDYILKTKSKLKSPVMHFPLPPGVRPTSSSSSTSDSSIYYNRNRMKSDQKYNLTQNLSTTKDDNLYAMIINKKEKKRDHQQQKTHRRKYLISGNRVGSIEDPDTKNHTNSDSDMFDSSVPLQYDHSEGFHPNMPSGSHYHNNKLLLDHHFDSKNRDVYDIKGVANGVEAINSELLKSLQIHRHHDRSSADSGSIGSFLSMASVKSFPRCSVPEPLSRVLEPVSVTHLDHYDPEIEKHGKTNKYNLTDPSQFQRSSSDGADPGVIGPIVWEIHKKEMEKEKKNALVITSPIRDPALTRNRFEGLLEGAINLYKKKPSNDDPKTSSTDKSMESVIQRDFRGKSAPKLKNAGNLSRTGSGTIRPLTAGNATSTSAHSTQPPSPSNKKAWGSGAPSPLVRPMSAGPFHRPIPPTVDVTRVLAPHNSSDVTAITTAPLIQAIQDELKKFNRD